MNENCDYIEYKLAISNIIHFYKVGYDIKIPYLSWPKEVCNGGVACSLLKLGSLEKIVEASLFHSALHPGTIFLWKKRCHIFLTKKPKKIMMPNRFFDHLQLFLLQPFFDQVQNKDSALKNPCQSWTKVEESRLWGTYLGCVH